MTDKPLSERINHIQEHWNEYHRSEIYTLASALKRVLAAYSHDTVNLETITLAIDQEDMP